MSGSGESDHLRKCGLRKTLSSYAMFLGVTDLLDVERLVSVGNPCKMINVFLLIHIYSFGFLLLG